MRKEGEASKQEAAAIAEVTKVSIAGCLLHVRPAKCPMGHNRGWRENNATFAEKVFKKWEEMMGTTKSSKSTGHWGMAAGAEKALVPSKEKRIWNWMAKNNVPIVIRVCAIQVKMTGIFGMQGVILSQKMELNGIII